MYKQNIVIHIIYIDDFLYLSIENDFNTIIKIILVHIL